jgi:hypothetical protein
MPLPRPYLGSAPSAPELEDGGVDGWGREEGGSR